MHERVQDLARTLRAAGPAAVQIVMVVEYSLLFRLTALWADKLRRILCSGDLHGKRMNGIVSVASYVSHPLTTLGTSHFAILTGLILRFHVCPAVCLDLPVHPFARYIR